MYQSVALEIDGKLLRGVVRTPQERGKFPTLIFMHGFTVDKVGPARLYEMFAKRCQEEGIAVIRFDFYGCGESDGDFSEMTIGTEMKEMMAIYKWAKTQSYVDTDNMFLGGHSMGGLLATLLASELKPCGIIAWSPALLMYYEAARRARTMRGETLNGYDINGLELSKAYLKEASEMNFIEMARGYDGKVLIIHGEKDEEIVAACVYRYRQLYEKRLAIHLVKDADHQFTSLSWRKELYDISLEFLKKESGLEV